MEWWQILLIVLGSLLVLFVICIIFYKQFGKRLFDIAISFLSLLVFGFPMLIISIIVKLTSKGPVLFKQKRIGKNGKVFNILKFRTMVVGAEAQGVYSDNKDKRVTKFGKFLRKTSLDELPQLLNMFIGQMSLIGPRPPLTYHPWPYEEYTNEQRKMFLVRSGMTGWAQVHGRKEVEWNERIELNVWYVEHLSFWLDFKIFFMTFGKLFKAEGNQNKGETVKKQDKKEESK